ncbi:hypothetical protein NUH88_12390 [Nisaea acidiphila]|uniref:Uncharacterized protein n=1 Tax=Nisaea acidiphila TaxID=1862145 RepID=A0A9J7AM37_9PROT|nr:hypothetical protein [Nisaea acidiphila]UUX48214.1 hypothetical protein NUH88_12390 [Nisaea acidiphila]
MSNEPDFENRNRGSVLQRLGMQELEKFHFSEKTDGSDERRREPVSETACPEHPLGQDLFFVLWNSHRS